VSTAQDFERDWWGDCANTFHEEQKQLVYARRWGLKEIKNAGHPPTFDLGGMSVLDVGGGPVSLLLKCANGGRRTVLDPCKFPGWVNLRYVECGIDHIRLTAEEWIGPNKHYDEVWIYNVLQHVEDPEEVIMRCRRWGRAIRIWEWVGIAAYEGHPHELRAEQLDAWLGGRGSGRVQRVDEDGAVGIVHYGLFPS
jgi:2-polyprenyl-3-methyl-5-hydroxy-6-metoxy-1,4-benzoquinol methylase